MARIHFHIGDAPTAHLRKHSKPSYGNLAVFDWQCLAQEAAAAVSAMPEVPNAAAVTVNGHRGRYCVLVPQPDGANPLRLHYAGFIY